MADRRIFRFAPSPNGRLHLGHAYSALLNQRLAEQAGGDLILRLEDIDRARSTPALAEAVLEDLAWLGIAWTGSVRRQSDHFEDFAAALDRLLAQGLAYPCFCTRGDIARAVAGRPHWPHDPDGSPLYPGTCRALGRAESGRRMVAGVPHAIRLDMRAALAAVARDLDWLEYREGPEGTVTPAQPERWGDAVLRRKDIPTSYHMAVVVDDAIQGISDVVRGEDLLPATALHRLLQTLLDLPVPVYHHHRLILDSSGEKLAKSRGSTTLADLRRGGATPEEVRQRLGLR